MLETQNENEVIPAPLPRLAYTMQETANMLGVSYISVHRLLQRGLLKSSTALRHKVISMREIQRFLNDTTEGVK